MKKVMLARQPIFDTQKKTYAYELLYRGDLSDISDDAKTATVLSNTLNQFGIDTITDGSLIFVNLSKQFLLSDFPELYREFLRVSLAIHVARLEWLRWYHHLF